MADSLSNGFWDRHAFSVGGAGFSWRDVILAAMARGEWSAFERRLAHGLACEARAASADAPADCDAVDEAATAFRYDHDLISAADVTAWLDRVGVCAEEWTAYFTRAVLRDRWDGELDDVLDRYAPSARVLVEAAVSEGICSGVFEAFERTLAGRAAFVFESDAAGFERALRSAASPAIDAEADRLAELHAHWLSRPASAEMVARLRVILQIDAVFHGLVERVTSNGQMAAIVEANRLEWMRLELDVVSFPTENAAREALLCVREDGLSLYDVAALAHRAVTRSTVTLQDLAPGCQEQLIGAEPGRVLGPLATTSNGAAEGQQLFDVYKLIGRKAPTADDPAVAARAREELVTRALTRAVREHVKRHG